MKIDRPTRVTNCLIITDSCVEAIDIEEAIRRVGISKISHCQRSDGTGEIARVEVAPDTLVFLACDGLSTTQRSKLLDAASNAAHLVLIDPPDNLSQGLGAARLTRPFDDGAIHDVIHPIV